jgi:hypothetical protein
MLQQCCLLTCRCVCCLRQVFAHWKASGLVSDEDRQRIKQLVLDQAVRKKVRLASAAD